MIADFIYINKKPINLYWVFSHSPELLNGETLKQKFDYKKNKFVATHGFIIIEHGNIEHQFSFDNEPEARKWFDYLLAEIAKRKRFNP